MQVLDEPWHTLHPYQARIPTGMTASSLGDKHPLKGKIIVVVIGGPTDVVCCELEEDANYLGVLAYLCLIGR